MKLWIELFCAALVGLAPLTCSAQMAAAPATNECLRIDEGPGFSGSSEEQDRVRRAWIETCRAAVASEPDNRRLQAALARAFNADGRRAEALAIRRELAKAGDADALYDIYDTYKSYYRTVDGKPKLVGREEAEASLRKSAELGQAEAMWMLAVLLDRGSTVRRNPAEAAIWAERVMKKPPKGMTAADVEVRLGSFLVKTNMRATRDRGLQILEKYATGRGRADARAYLAMAIRRDNPTRARSLLEAALRDAPGLATPPLAEMLIGGEGGSRDERRALSLLQSKAVTELSAVKAALGRLYVEGRLLPKDVQEGIRLIRQDAIWSQESRLEVMKLLATNPDARIERAEDFVYDALEAAEVGEPGALAALYELKMSSSAQFMDRGGACALIDKYLKQGREAALARSSACL